MFTPLRQGLNETGEPVDPREISGEELEIYVLLVLNEANSEESKFGGLLEPSGLSCYFQTRVRYAQEGHRFAREIEIFFDFRRHALCVS